MRTLTDCQRAELSQIADGDLRRLYFSEPVAHSAGFPTLARRGRKTCGYDAHPVYK